jgi:cytochrome c553
MSVIKHISQSHFLHAVGVLLIGLPLAAPAAGSIEAGKTKSVTCAACHGADGNSVNPEWPSLAGQHAGYIIASLNAYRDGTRDNVLMLGQVQALTEQDQADLAAYYASQQPVPRVADPALASRGERLYRAGNLESGVAACIACHGPNGRGNSPAGYPDLAGQHAQYTADQLRQYRSEKRSSDPNQMMRNITARMTDDEILAVASYLQGLR